MIPIDQILGTTSLVELVERAGGKPRQKGGRWECACPLHQGDNQTAFSIFAGTDGREVWHCFTNSCGGGDAIAFVEKWRGLDFKSACEYLGGKDIAADAHALAAIAAERARSTAERLEQEIATAQKVLDDLRQSEKHLFYHNSLNDYFNKLWDDRGIDESWRGFWYLGGCADKIITGGHHTPTLTIPIFDQKREVLNIKHRLLNPINPKDKYRPEREGLKMPPFLAFPEMGYDGSVIWVIEGEIKSMVACATANNPDWQFIGTPGQGRFEGLADQLFGKNVITVPDPGSERNAWEFTKKVGAKWLVLPEKIDDHIIRNGLNQNHLNAWYKQAMRIK